ncbi:hypothetical protein NM961_23805, partial [Tahibacter sp. P2K]|nr:hypothetical protein [Tahibacter harae]
NSALKRLRSVLPSDFFLLICLTPDCDIESLIRVSEKQGQDHTSGCAGTGCSAPAFRPMDTSACASSMAVWS